MNKPKQLYFILLFFTVNNFYSQLTPPAPYPNGYMNTMMVSDTKEPSVARFQEYSFVPVDLYSGKAKIEIPFFEIKLDDLTIPISLEYNTQGIQVNSVSSRVGTGWILNAGGNIGRSVKEVNDFHFVSRIFNAGGGLGGMPVDCPGTLGHPLRVGWKYRNSNVCISTAPVGYETGPNNIDISPDVFTAAAPGLLTQFYYPNSELQVEPITEVTETSVPTEIEPSDTKFSSKIKDLHVTYPNDPNFPSFFQNIPDNKRRVRDYFDFDITHDGYKYSFNDYDLSYLDSPNSLYSTPPYGGIEHQELYWDISAWHLNKIENINTNKKVDFIYESVPYYITSKQLYKFFLDQPQYGDYYLVAPDNNNIVETNTHLSPKRIKSIISDEAIIQFQYNHARKDLIGDYALTNIQVFNKNNQLVKEYKFNYSYMNNNLPDGFGKRLFLDYIEEVGKDNVTVDKYVFSYFDGTLPNSNSTNESDWYGYYKKNINGGDRPILFMNDGLKNFSILPVALTGISGYPLRGNRYIDPTEDDMKIGMLKKIIYPTGGYTKLQYEANRFRLNNQEVFGGGLRISAQELAGSDKIRKLKYTYKEQDGKTSGYVNNVPSYGYSTSYNVGLENYSYNDKINFIASTFVTMQRSLVSVDKTQNTYVGYSSVREEEEGKGYIDYEYSSPKEFPSVLPVMQNPPTPLGTLLRENSAFPFLDIPISYDVRTGKLKSKKVYNISNVLVHEDVFQYNYESFVGLTLGRRRYLPIEVGSNYKGFYISGGLLSHRNLIATKTSKDYFTNNTFVQSTEDYQYDALLPTVKTFTVTSGQNVFSTKFYYPKDLLALNIQSGEMQQLINQNRNSTVIKTERYKNNIKINEKIVKYASNISTANKLQPVSFYDSMSAIDITSDIDKVFSIDRYDEKGKILQTSDKSKKPTTIVWGYSKTLPIAEINGATYENILGNISDIVNNSDADIDNQSEETLIESLDIFRKNLSSTYFVTTYTHDPLVGLTSTTNNSGTRKFYKYDNIGRLEKTLDSNKNILDLYKYHYSLLKFYNKTRSQVFYKNNCASWMIGSQYTYTVPEDKYSSFISQADADQKAQNEINMNGQNTANANTSCMFVSCGFTPNYYANINFSSIQQTGPDHISMILTYNANPPSGMTYTSGGVSVGYIGAGCRPSTTKSINSGNWKVTITTDGYVIVSANSGSPLPNSTVGFSIEYDKN